MTYLDLQQHAERAPEGGEGRLGAGGWRIAAGVVLAKRHQGLGAFLWKVRASLNLIGLIEFSLC